MVFGGILEGFWWVFSGFWWDFSGKYQDPKECFLDVFCYIKPTKRHTFGGLGT